MKLYDLLGVQPPASKDDLRKAYKKLAVQHHPDKGGDADKFKEISHAYEVLSDDEKRRMYDQLGDEGFNDAMNGGGGPGGPGGGFDPAMDIFNQMFHNFGGFHFSEGQGQRPRQHTRRGDHLHNLHISLEQAYHGVTKTVKINITKPCVSCSVSCNTCQGRGHIVDMHRMGIFTQTVTRPCHVCKGRGKNCQPRPSCGNCKGVGSTSSDIFQEIKIPAGVCTGYDIRLAGLGEQPQDNNETAGDMIIHITVDENPFTRTGKNGRDLVYKQSLTLAETIIGKNIIIPHFVEPIKINTNTLGIIVPGKTYIIKNKGMQKGDLHLIFDVQYPDKVLNEDELEIMQQAFSKVGLGAT